MGGPVGMTHVLLPLRVGKSVHTLITVFLFDIVHVHVYRRGNGYFRMVSTWKMVPLISVIT